MKTALGKGLSALIPDKAPDIIEIELERIVAGAEQPRKTFKDDSLKELAASIKEKGIIQPVLVRRVDSGGFMLIAGERRFRAAHLAGLKKIPAIVRDTTPEDALEIALIENIQREDLNPIETAQAFERLMKQFGLTQEQMSDKVGKDRATVANFLRLLGLPEEIKKLVREGTLSMGHAKAILSIEGAKEQVEAARNILKNGLNVRETEKIVKAAREAKPKAKAAKDVDVASLEQKLIKALGTKVKLKSRGKKGSIEIEYYSLEELDRLLDIFLGK